MKVLKKGRRAYIWALKHTEKRGGGGAPAKSSLALEGAGARIFMQFRRQVTLGQIQEGLEV